MKSPLLLKSLIQDGQDTMRWPWHCCRALGFASPLAIADNPVSYTDGVEHDLSADSPISYSGTGEGSALHL